MHGCDRHFCQSTVVAQCQSRKVYTCQECGGKQLCCTCGTSWRSCSNNAISTHFLGHWPIWSFEVYCSARFHIKNFTAFCTATVSTSNIFPEIGGVTHQFSLDQHVLQSEFQSSSSSMLNLIDFLVHISVTVRVLRARTRSLDREQLSVLVGVSPSFLRSSLLSSVSRGLCVHVFRSNVCFVLGTCHFLELDVSSTHVVLYP